MHFDNFKEFLHEVENQFDKKIKKIRSDRRQEYESTRFNSFVQFLGIIYEAMPRYSPASYIVAERII